MIVTYHREKEKNYFSEVKLNEQKCFFFTKDVSYVNHKFTALVFQNVLKIN